MKTMLGPKYDGQVAEENRFHPSMLSNFLKSLKVSNSGDTNTNWILKCLPTWYLILSLGKNGFACGFDQHFSLLWPQWHWKRRHKIHEASVQRVRSDLILLINFMYSFFFFNEVYFLSFLFSHGECPSQEVTGRFIRQCDNFIEKNPEELIGKWSVESEFVRWCLVFSQRANFKCQRNVCRYHMCQTQGPCAKCGCQVITCGPSLRGVPLSFQFTP